MENTITKEKSKAISSRFLILTAFISGMTIMAIEMAASRLMAPYFGTSVFIWTNLLGVIMLALSLGYWLGGKYADKYPTREFLYGLLLAASFILLLLPFISPWIMGFVSNGVKEGEISLVINSFLSSLVVFCVPFLILGMVSPTIIRLLSHTVDHSGRVAGQVYAASTVGSIIGTFLPTLIFVPLIGTRKTVVLFACALLIVAIIGFRRRLLFFLPILFLAALILIPQGYSFGDEVIYQTESPYTYIQVVEDDYYGHILQQDEGYAMHSFYNPDKVLTDSYWDYLLPAPYFQSDNKQQKVAVIGSAGGTAFRVWQETAGDEFDFNFEGAEIDPTVVELSKEYFGMDQYDNVHVKAQDGRIFLQQSKDVYDIVLLDAYHQIYMPPHLTSVEFFRLVKDKMMENGVMVANVNSLFIESEVYQRFLRSLQEVFEHVWVVSIGAGRYNYLFYATNGRGNMFDAIEQIPENYAVLKQELRGKTVLADTINYNVALITDDMPLSEVLFDRMIGQWIFDNGDEALGELK